MEDNLHEVHGQVLNIILFFRMYLLLYKSTHMAGNYGSKNVPRRVGTMQNSAEGW